MAPFAYLYVKFLIFIFTIQTINRDEYMLPNITLGYHLYDSCLDPTKAVKSVLQILSGPEKTIPNYSCMNQGKLAMFIGDNFSATTKPLAQILGVYGYTQLHHYVKKLPYPLNEENSLVSFFDEHGEYDHPYVILNWRFYPNETFSYGDWIGNYTTRANNTQNLDIDAKKVMWKTGGNKVPKSQCSDNCLPGQRKVPDPGMHICCYDCLQCSEGEISNITDSENCIGCSEYEWSNEKRDQCVPKVEEFLSYFDDILTIILASVSVLLCLLTILVFIIFILFWETPIVRANNRSLSFVLLLSIMLSFLCVFLFLGRPGDITCMLRQTSFGIIFSIAVSSVLAKTIMVYIAFRATKPGSAWKRLIKVKLSSPVVVFFSFIQVIINICWLAASPPFQEMDTHSYKEKIIIQCNEGSVIAFYTLLGYMGLLAVVSFVIAFLVRTLPDSFNEAKYITFSMLVFCSVWIAMIPAYLSTKGKYMVAVEVFAILTSSAGLLGCIF
uniref:G-protein coupled receptors family 3 profile domain-containing protein n=1 Tax=Leptobrachium leishanense TaxID=445787 RepID=A0A8C5MN82_9ANUR